MKHHLLLFSCCVFTLSLAAQKPVFDSLIRIDSREIYFDFAVDTLKMDADSIIQELYALYTKRKADSIYITAHTDNVGTPEQNRKLSQKRAKSVKTKLLSVGVPDSVMRIEEFGESLPVASNETDAGRQRNRRATIDIYKKLKLTLLSGRLLDAVSKQGIAGTVDISTAATQTSVTTDTSGHFKTAVPMGAIIKLLPSAEGYAAAKDTMFKPSKPVQPYIELLLKPMPAALVTQKIKVQIKDPQTGKPIAGGTVIVDNGKEKKQQETDANGYIEIEVTKGKDFEVVPLIKNLSLEPIVVKAADIQDKVVMVQPDLIKPGDAIALSDLIFEFDLAVLEEESRPELETILKFMQLNDHLKVEIAGHGDNTYIPPVAESHILYILSQERAQVVYDYLIDKGIDANRLSYKGYGNWEPVYKNPLNDAQHRANRRVEIRILNAENAKN